MIETFKCGHATVTIYQQFRSLVTVISISYLRSQEVRHQGCHQWVAEAASLSVVREHSEAGPVGRPQRRPQSSGRIRSHTKAPRKLCSLSRSL